jgi:putative ABC transport system permease protein
MQIKPILAALKHHRLATLLIALEIALACAVLCNACFLIANRINAMHMVSGVNEKSLAFVSVTGFDAEKAKDINARMVAGLSGIQGVKSVGIVNSLPFTPQSGRVGISLNPSQDPTVTVVDLYLGDAAALRAMDLHLVEGRMPADGDYQSVSQFAPSDASVLITRSLANTLWPGSDPLGKEFWCCTSHLRVMGVVDHLVVPQPEGHDDMEREFSAFIPSRPGKGLAGSYVVNADPKDIQRVFRDAVLVTQKVAPDVVFDHENSGTLNDIREQYFHNDRIMVGMMLGVIFVLMLVTALGIVGLASFWVQQRRKQIGVRRAVGATRGDILRYFLAENFLIVTGGILLGVVFALALNLVLMEQYEVPRLPLYYLPIAAVALWALGQLAVLAPALRAAAVPPVVATRTV